MAEPQRLVAVDLGRIGYQEAWDLQRRLVEARREDAQRDDLLLFCEHPQVVTVGRRSQVPGRDSGHTAGVRAAEIPVVEVERGGAATYHGPGQLVGYPIVRLSEGERDLHAFLRALETALIQTIAGATGLPADRREGVTGVWVGERKVASIGIACRAWVTYHGFALNLTTDLAPFSLFRPCDLDAQVMASLASLGANLAPARARADVHAHLARLLGREPAVGPR